MDYATVLSEIRRQALIIAKSGWDELGELVDYILPNPLNPIAILPIATGIAVGGEVADLIPIAATVILTDVALRIADDCADQDDLDALYQSIGIGRAINCAMALNTTVVRHLLYLGLSPERLVSIFNNYCYSFLQVCHGQDDDMQKRVKTLSEYEELVKLKTVAAYEFAASVGSRVITSDSNAISLCSDCGIHLGWMAQILDDIEALWFPELESYREIEKITLPVLLGLSFEHPNSKLLQDMLNEESYKRLKICTLLDEMNIRRYLLDLALDHRDLAIKVLDTCENSEGSKILKVWLDWLWRDGERLLNINAI